MSKRLHTIIVLSVLVSFIVSSVQVPAFAQIDPMPFMPQPGVMVPLSPEYTPAYLKGIVIHPENALKFDFIIYKGDKPLSDAQKREEYTKLTKYFLASLAIPDDDQWVNLSPYEKDRIIKDDFGKTEMGRDLLAQDYMLKQITASLIYPEDNLGKKFWDKLYSQAQKQYGTTNIPVNTFNKVWILPDDALIYEKGNTAYVLKNHLRVMLEEDYLSLQKHSGIAHIVIPASPAESGAKAGIQNTHSIASNIIRQIVLPELQKEVNEDANFAPLRQVYSGMLLATWFKRTLKTSLLGQIYANKAKVKGVDQDPRTNEEIYRQYLQAYKKGVFNFIKEDTNARETVPKKYFSGGTGDYAMAATTFQRDVVQTTSDPSRISGIKAQLSVADIAAVSMQEDKTTVGPAIAANLSAHLPSQQLDGFLSHEDLVGGDHAMQGTIDQDMHALKTEIEKIKQQVIHADAKQVPDIVSSFERLLRSHVSAPVILDFIEENINEMNQTLLEEGFFLRPVSNIVSSRFLLLYRIIRTDTYRTSGGPVKIYHIRLQTGTSLKRIGEDLMWNPPFLSPYLVFPVDGFREYLQYYSFNIKAGRVTGVDQFAFSGSAHTFLPLELTVRRKVAARLKFNFTDAFYSSIRLYNLRFYTERSLKNLKSYNAQFEQAGQAARIFSLYYSIDPLLNLDNLLIGALAGTAFGGVNSLAGLAGTSDPYGISKWIEHLMTMPDSQLTDYLRDRAKAYYKEITGHDPEPDFRLVSSEPFKAPSKNLKGSSELRRPDQTPAAGGFVPSSIMPPKVPTPEKPEAEALLVDHFLAVKQKLPAFLSELKDSLGFDEYEDELYTIAELIQEELPNEQKVTATELMNRDGYNRRHIEVFLLDAINQMNPDHRYSSFREYWDELNAEHEQEEFSEQNIHAPVPVQEKSESQFGVNILDINNSYLEDRPIDGLVIKKISTLHQILWRVANRELSPLALRPFNQPITGVYRIPFHRNLAIYVRYFREADKFLIIAFGSRSATHISNFVLDPLFKGFLQNYSYENVSTLKELKIPAKTINFAMNGREISRPSGIDKRMKIGANAQLTNIPDAAMRSQKETDKATRSSIGVRLMMLVFASIPAGYVYSIGNKFINHPQEAVWAYPEAEPVINYIQKMMGRPLIHARSIGANTNFSQPINSPNPSYSPGPIFNMGKSEPYNNNHNRAMIANTGGIDLNSANLNLRIKRDGNGVPLPLAQQDLAQLSNIQGLDPIILSIKPASQTALFSQLISQP